MAFDIAAGRQATITRRATITVTLSTSSYLTSASIGQSRVITIQASMGRVSYR
jgi:hypothetical protein